MIDESKILQGMQVVSQYPKEPDIESGLKEKVLASEHGDMKKYENVRKLLGSISELSGKTESLKNELLAVGFDSLETWEAELDNYYRTSERVIRPAPKDFSGFIIPLCPPKYEVDGKRATHYALDGDYDFTLIMGRGKHEVIVAEYEPVSHYVDPVFCQQNDIIVTRYQLFGGKNHRYFFHKGTVGYNLVFENEIYADYELLKRLDRLLCIDIFSDFGVSTYSRGNDILVESNGKKIAGINVLNLQRSNPVTGESWNRNAQDALAMFNVEWDSDLAEGALRGEKRPADQVTSLSAEAGQTIDPGAVKQSFLAHLADRFNLNVRETVWQS